MVDSLLRLITTICFEELSNYANEQYVVSLLLFSSLAVIHLMCSDKYKRG